MKYPAREAVLSSATSILNMWISCLLGQYSYDGNGLPEAVPTPLERAATLFRALDRRNLGVLTKQEFMEGYMQRSGGPLQKKSRLESPLQITGALASTR